MKKLKRAIDILKQGDPNCFDSRRMEMQSIMDEWMKVKSYCDQFPDSAYHKMFLEGAERRLNDKIHKLISARKLAEKGCL